jgi:AraC family transcriptional regulator
LARRFRAACGCTPYAFVTAKRLARAKELLLQGRLNVSEVAEALGFPNIHTFSRWFRREAGIPPRVFRQRPTVL